MAWEYQREEFAPRHLPGAYRCEIVEVSDNPSKSSGKPMITITLKINGTDLKVKYYIVEGPYANRNFTALFDSFDIDEGDFDLVGWVGAVGAVMLVRDPNNQKFLKVAYFIPKTETGNLPPWKGPKPERQRIVNGNAFLQVEDNDSPF